LIFSFLVSWLIYNWKIPVALIWFDEKQISANGCNSIFEFIEDEWTRNGYFWYPFGVALLYTFGFPIVKNLISAAQTWALKWGENWNLNISRQSKVSIDKYLSLRNEYSSKIDELEKIISKENEMREYNLKLFTEKGELEAKNYQLQEYIETLEHDKNQISNVRFLNGQWTYKYVNERSEMIENQIYINEGKLFYLNNEGDRLDKGIFITSFYINETSGALIFIKKNFNDKDMNVSAKYSESNFVNILSFSTVRHHLKGTENGNQVEYIKVI
jgi:hypothetical protein